MNVSLAAISTLVLFITLVFFREKPPLYGKAKLQRLKAERMESQKTK
jgi:hypothetical protein